MPWNNLDREEDESDSNIEEEQLRPYQYNRLTSNHSIRLLKLHAGSKKQDLVCDLVEEKLGGDHHVNFEALSWSWGTAPWTGRIKIREGDEDFVFNVPPTLVSALKALRLRRKVRTIWVDLICINQARTEEKNHQVPMMSSIYGNATKVCVWIGEADEDSDTAIDFIQQEVLRLQAFDSLCESPAATPKWRAMLNLMKRDWFERRWVVQEIALANSAELYCGTKSISWKDFSDAVQLFVEVETATHRLSDVMRKDPAFYHIPGWFEYVSALGASLLVDATGSLFRISEDKRRTPLQTLEYLVSNLSVFKASEPRDTVFSLLAVARDTNPIAVLTEQSDVKVGANALKGLNMWAKNQQRKPYPVDYNLPLVQIFKDFIEFAIRQSSEIDPTRALDILCRPWAPPSVPQRMSTSGSDSDSTQRRLYDIPLPSWIPQLSGAAYAMFQHANSEYRMGRKNADPLVGLPAPGQRNYSAAETKKVELKHLNFKKRDEYYSMYVSGFILDTVKSVEVASQSGNIPEEWVAAAGWTDLEKDPPDAFWKTLVADRGRHGRNPPTYYGRACKESISKGLASGSLNTTELINEGRCSVVAEFFRRVQAVIWNRSLMRTRQGHLGIVRKDVRVDDKICILYGCSVPVILRQHHKSKEVVEHERKEDEQEREKMRREATIRIQRAFRESKARKTAKQKETSGRGGTPASSSSAATSCRSAQSKTSASCARQIGSPPENGSQKQKPLPPKKPSRDLNKASHLPPRSGQQEEVLGGPSSSQTRRQSDAGGESKTDSMAESAEMRQPQSKERALTDADEYYWYEFIGECYVHSMMDGEAIKYQNVHEIKPNIFELR
ncbi:uncharacterized protein PV09_07049 [Verruconis gallopava]|uniref:Heterokaryon incompatibility domain-containing protein n=1 Tax=Verruconis gallopava TaxID=253628 RepID=A0A0D2A515_9PEZI|nr:uncharacterized protein PV09_07049 [Verruconis gallopava]KIW01575.1 hypothetical protein PV09_07049 [Verruconis gallopava]